MKRFLIASFFTLALVLGATGAVSSAHANALDTGVSNNQLDANGNILGTTGAASVSANAAAQTAAAQTPTNYVQPSPDQGYNSVMQWIMGIFAWLVGVAALTLDTTVFYTVVTMGDYVHKLTAIGVAWRILRDIGNIALIFGFLAIGITTILNVNWYGGGKKMLPMLLVAAVFLNFSLFFAEAIIDTGNLFATQFYKQINGGDMPTAALTASATVKNEGISNKLMAQLGLQSLYDVNNNSVKKNIFNGTNPSLVGFMGILLFIVTAFVLFSLSFVLIARFVFLIFLIILAPVGFAGLAVPMLSKRAGQWWSKLFEQTITAPVLLLLLYVALAVITDAQFLTGFKSTSGGWLGFIDNNNLAGFGGVILSFLVAMGLLLLVTIVAKNISAFGASKATAYAGKLSFGATALAGRSTVGWGANRLAKYARGTRLARVPLVGTGIVKGLDKVATGSFDVRGATSIPGSGVPQKGGYRAELKGRVESRTNYAKGLTGRSATREEKGNLAQALESVAQARQTRVVASSDLETSRTSRTGAAADVARLEEEKRNDQYWDTNPENVRKLEEANTKLSQSTTEVLAKETQLEEAKNKEQEKGKEHGDIESKIKEATSDKVAQEKYAKVLEAGLGEGTVFNKYFNLAANTEAAKKIRKEAKGQTDTEKIIASLKKEIERDMAAKAAAVPAAGGAAPSAPAADGH